MNPRYPDLRGQLSDFLRQQLRLFREGQRGGSPYAPLMQTIAEILSYEEIESVVTFYGSVGLHNPAPPAY